MASRGVVSEEKRSEKAVWQEYFDEKSGKPYFWNADTLEVTWQRPKELMPKRKVAHTQKKGSGSKGLVVYGPALPSSRPEEVIREKARQFEAKFADQVVADIQQMMPPDWTVDGSISKSSNQQELRPRRLHSKPFQWRRGSPCLSEWRATVAKVESESANCAVALIAGVYGEDSDDDKEKGEDEKEENKNNRDNNGKKERLSSKEDKESNLKLRGGEESKRSSRIKVKATISKPLKPKNVGKTHRAFLEAYQSDDEEEEKGDSEENEKNDKVVETKSDVSYDRRGRKIYESSNGPPLKKSIDSVAETILDKLNALGASETTAHHSLRGLAIRAETLCDAWDADALSASYMQRIMDNLSSALLSLEQSEVVAPKGFKAIWDSGSKRYVWESLKSGQTFHTKPSEDDPNSLNEDNVEGQVSSPPPLPPPSTSPVPPPPPPEPEPSSSSTMIEDMELDDDNSSNEMENFAPAKDTIADSLDAFYASLNDDTNEAQSAEPSPITVLEDALAEGSSRSNSPGILNERERKKRKANAGSTNFISSLKRRGVDGLVAKWQNIQEEVNRKQT